MAELPIPEGSDPWLAETPTRDEPRVSCAPASERNATGNMYGDPNSGDVTSGTGLGGRHHALLGLDEVVGGLKALAGVNLWGLSELEVLEFFDGVERARRLVAGVLFAAVRDLGGRDLRGVFGEEDLPTVAGLVREQLKLRPADARRMVDLARDLDTTYPGVGEALGGTAIGQEQAAVIVGALRSLPADTPGEQRAWAEQFLLAQADMLDAGDLAALGRTIRDRLRDQLHPPGSDPADRGDQARRRELHLTDQPDGTTRIHGTLDAEGAATLRAALQPLSKPKPHGENPEDHRTVPQLRADALVDITKRVLDSGALPLSRGSRPHVSVTTTLDSLLGHDGATPATTGQGQPLSHATLERLCCDADLTHILLSSEGMPLELGRTRRLVPPWLRRALIARDGGCAFPNCTRTAEFTDAHHIIPWTAGGTTDLSNTVLLCGFHHRVVHRSGWIVMMAPDGHPCFVPPYAVDPHRQPRRNPLHRTLEHLFTGSWEPPHDLTAPPDFGLAHTSVHDCHADGSEDEVHDFGPEHHAEDSLVDDAHLDLAGQENWDRADRMDCRNHRQRYLIGPELANTDPPSG